MFQAIRQRLFRWRHSWRKATFKEMAELYMSGALHTFAIKLTSSFIIVYMYQLGYSIFTIALYATTFFALKIPFSFLSAKIISKKGPKHGIMYSNMIHILPLLLFLLLPYYRHDLISGVILGLVCVASSLSIVIFDFSYRVSFSKAGQRRKVGRQLGTWQILQNVANILAPLTAGIIASVFGMPIVIMLACFVLVLSIFPILLTKEIIYPHEKVNLRFREMYRAGFFSSVATGFDWVASGIVWYMFIVTVALAGAGRATYAELGGLISLGMFVSFIAAFMIGRVMDKVTRSTKKVLVTSVILKSLVTLARPLAVMPLGVAVVNTLREPLATAEEMSFSKGLYDTAERSRNRTAYLMYISIAKAFGAFVACFVWAMGALFIEDQMTMYSIFYLIAAIVVLKIASPRFPLFKK